MPMSSSRIDPTTSIAVDLRYEASAPPAPVLSPEALTHLSQNGGSPISEGGYLRVRVRDISSSPPPQVASEEPTTLIPHIIESIETLLFIGFTPLAATHILERYHQCLAYEEDPQILSFAKGYVRSYPDVALRDDDWWSAMDAMGINNEMQEGIMDPQFEGMRFMNTAWGWILDTIKAKFMWLRRLNGQVISQYNTHPPWPIAVPLNTTDHQVHDGEIEFLKGGIQVQLEQALPSTGDYPPPHNKIHSLQSFPIRGDFTTRSPAIYFPQQRTVASQYAAYAHRRMQQKIATSAPPRYRDPAHHHPSKYPTQQPSNHTIRQRRMEGIRHVLSAQGFANTIPTATRKPR
ncbi:MAG: hypothetical protein Q9168_003145 [Polycauliona sp. 1 TL-2023]